MLSRKSIDIANKIENIFPSATVAVVNPLVYTNVRDVQNAAFENWVFSYNIPQEIEYREISLLRYEAGTIVDGDGSYVTYSGGHLVAEQLPGWEVPTSELINDILRRADGMPSITEECLLVARYGETTWGHWLLEMLPKIVLAETAFPNRFRYVVPSNIFVPSERVSAEYVSAVVGSLVAYGIQADRLIGLPSGRALSFEALYGIALEHEMHPYVMALMQSAVRRSPRRHLPRRTAILRRSSEFRAISNRDEVADFFAHRGYSIIDIASQPFDFQVALFEGVESLVAGLGSELAGSIYMPDRADILSLAPGGWHDNYFALTFARKAAYVADVRGNSSDSIPGDVGRSSYAVNLTRISTALDVLSARAEVPNLPGAVILDGQIQPRSVGPKIYEIRFGLGGDSLPYQRHGWCHAEGDRTWSIGQSSALEIPDDLPEGDGWLEILGACPGNLAGYHS